MISTFWFLIKTSILISAFALVMSLGGAISIDLFGYSISTTVGIFLVVLCIALWALAFLGKTIKTVVEAPKSLVTYSDKKAHAKGTQAIAQGLSAVAAGDAKAADYYTKRVNKYLKGDNYGLHDLMQVLAARLNGDDKKLRKSLHSLMTHKETSFLGLKGLLQSEIDRRDYGTALTLAEKAYRQHPSQPWIIKTLYDLQIQTGEFDKALHSLKKVQKTKGIVKSDINDEKAALFMGQNNIAKAYKAAPLSLPVGLAMLKQLANDNKRLKSLKIIQKIWAKNPHPILMDYWIKYAPKKAMNDQAVMAAWVEDLYQTNADNTSSALYTGEALINMGQKEQAKRFIKQAISQKPTTHAYQLMCQIDANGPWADHLATATQDKAWICTKTGQIYDEWMVITPLGHFNSVIWEYPEAVSIKPNTHSSISLLAA